MTRRLGWGGLWMPIFCTALSACGGGGGGSGNGAVATAAPVAGANVQAVSVTSGMSGQVPNLLMTSVTVCVPGTSTCQTIDNVQVDTGSSGLRLLASAVSLPLPSAASPGVGQVYEECGAFADGVVWGAVATADVKLAGESAASMSVQLIQDNGAGPAIPASCLAQGTPQDSQSLLGSNGILGVGLFLQDCGSFCAGTPGAIYYLCAAGNSCTETTMALDQQVGNPAAFFAQDNNGVILQLPAIPAAGAATAVGNMIFGIGTQANNTLSAAVIPVPADGTTAGFFTAVYRGATVASSFFDSGSSALFFDDASITLCASTSLTYGLYCPGPATALSAYPISVALLGSHGASVVNAAVANADDLAAQPGAANLNAFDDLAGPACAAFPGSFDFGMPFFFGRSVYTAFEQRATPNGTGPYVAYQ